MQRGKDVMFPCDQCYYKATHKSNLLRHLKSKHASLPFDQSDFKAKKKN